MAVESKPLFHPEVIRQHLRNFVLPASVEDSRPRLSHWADLINSGQADQLKETELLPDFLTDIFCALLGYTRPAGSPGGYTLSRETKVVVDGQQADAVLGRFQPDKREYIVALEGKGTRDPLEIPFGGRKMSAVDQCYRYAINLPCDWIIVTSMRETRLYHKGSNQQTYERFDTVRLAGDAGLLKRFVFLLGAARVVPDSGVCHFKDLLGKSETVGREITNRFYAFYAHLRQTVFARLRTANPAVLPQDILRCTQKLLDRILFCSFCEDRGLLPPETVRGAFDHSDPYNPRPVWNNFRGLFRSIDKGNSGMKIPAYNGGLFAHDEGLDDLLVPDDVCALFRDLAAHDFRPAREVAEADETMEIRSFIDVDILGHIFEQSITDLERIRRDLERGSQPAAAKDAKTRRKQEGAFYTPAFITRYIVGQTLGAVLATRFESLRKSEKTWIIFTRRGIDIDAYPAVKAHLNLFRSQLEPKPEEWIGSEWPGRKGGSYKWFEIQDSIDYWQQFKRPKISYQEIQFHPSYALDTQGFFGNNKTFFITCDDLYLLAALNSPLMWWHNWRYLPHMKDEALSPLGRLMETLPMAEPTSAIREAAEAAVRRLIEITASQQRTKHTLLDWLRVEYAIGKPTNKLQNLTALDSDSFIAEVRHIRGKKHPLTAAGLQALREEYTRTIEPARTRAAEALQLERDLSDLVNQAYGLTPAEIALMWATAPPRMPIPNPANCSGGL